MKSFNITPEKLLEYEHHNKRVDQTKLVFYISPKTYEGMTRVMKESMLSQFYIKTRLPEESTEGNFRSAIKTQEDPTLLPYSAEEQEIIDSFEKLPRACRRDIERKKPVGWVVLKNNVAYHRENLAKSPKCKH